MLCSGVAGPLAMSTIAPKDKVSYVYNEEHFV